MPSGRAAGLAAAVLGSIIFACFVALPLIGRPPVVRVGPLLLFFGVVVLLTARPWRWTPAEWTALSAWEPSTRVVYVAALVAGVVLFWFVLTRFNSGGINAIDFTVYYDRPTYQTAAGRFQFVESADDRLRAYRTYLAVHAHWVMVPLAALYLVAATPMWLLALSVVAVVAGAVITLRIIQHAGGSSLIASASALAFVLNDNTARTLNYGFHTEVLYAWFIPWMILAGVRRQWLSFLVAGLACVSVKEDSVMPILAVVVTLLLTSREWTSRSRMLLGVPLMLAAANLAVFQGWIAPRLSSTGALIYGNYWANYGPTVLSAFVEMLRQPLRVIWETVTSSFLTDVTPPHLYLPFIGWRWFVGTAPIVLLYGSATNAQLRSFGIYYAIVLVPFLVLGAAAGAARLAGWLWPGRARGRVWTAAAVLVGALLAGISDAGYSLRPWRDEIQNVRAALVSIGPESRVLVQSSLYPHAGYESRVQVLTDETLSDPQYKAAILLLAPGMGAYPLSSEEVARLATLQSVAQLPGGLIAVRR